MKLYKLFENIILREVGEPLTGNVSDEDVIDAINGKYFVNITYQDYPDAPPSKRYIQVYNFSDTVADNKAIRAYQSGGGSKTTPGRGGWKIFRLDRIRSWQPTKMKFYSPVDKFNPNGDRTMKSVHNIATFDDKYKTSKYQRKSTDFTSRDIANMSPEEFEKQYQRIQASREKHRVSHPNKPAYMAQGPEDTNGNYQATANDIYKLKNMIDVDVFDARQALAKSGGDIDSAIDWLNRQGFRVTKKSSYDTSDDEDFEDLEDVDASGEEEEHLAKLDAERKELEAKQAYVAKKEKEYQDRLTKSKFEREKQAEKLKQKELQKRLQQKLATKNNKNLKTNKNDNTTTSRP